MARPSSVRITRITAGERRCQRAAKPVTAAGKSPLRAFGYLIAKRVCTMPWYQAVLLLGSVALSLILLIRPTSDGRRMAFTLLIAALMLVTIGLALKDVTSWVSVAAWLAQ